MHARDRYGIYISLLSVHNYTDTHTQTHSLKTRHFKSRLTIVIQLKQMNLYFTFCDKIKRLDFKVNNRKYSAQPKQ